MKIATLGKVAIALAFPTVGMAYLAQNRIARNFAAESYYLEAIELIKGYKPAMEKLGQPVVIKKIDVSDSFNYQDAHSAKAKIPLIGQRLKAEVMIYATKENLKWNLDYMEIKYDNNVPAYKFYDSKLVTKANQNKPNQQENKN